jgi:chromosome segregation ATPase
MLLVGFTACVVFIITALDGQVKDDTQKLNSQTATIASLQQQVIQRTQERDAALQQSQTYSQALQDTQHELNKVQLEKQGLQTENEALHRQIDNANANNAAHAQTLPSQPVNPQSEVRGLALNPATTILIGFVLSITPLLSLLAGVKVFVGKRQRDNAQIAQLEEQIMMLQMYNAQLANKLVEMRQRYQYELAQAHRLNRP